MRKKYDKGRRFIDKYGDKVPIASIHQLTEFYTVITRLIQNEAVSEMGVRGKVEWGLEHESCI